MVKMKMMTYQSFHELLSVLLLFVGFIMIMNYITLQKFLESYIFYMDDDDGGDDNGNKELYKHYRILLLYVRLESEAAVSRYLNKYGLRESEQSK